MNNLFLQLTAWSLLEKPEQKLFELVSELLPPSEKMALPSRQIITPLLSQKGIGIALGRNIWDTVSRIADMYTDCAVYLSGSEAIRHACTQALDEASNPLLRECILKELRMPGDRIGTIENIMPTPFLEQVQQKLDNVDNTDGIRPWNFLVKIPGMIRNPDDRRIYDLLCERAYKTGFASLEGLDLEKTLTEIIHELKGEGFEVKMHGLKDRMTNIQRVLEYPWLPAKQQKLLCKKAGPEQKCEEAGYNAPHLFVKMLWEGAAQAHPSSAVEELDKHLSSIAAYILSLEQQNKEHQEAIASLQRKTTSSDREARLLGEVQSLKTQLQEQEQNAMRNLELLSEQLSHIETRHAAEVNSWEKEKELFQEKLVKLENDVEFWSQAAEEYATGQQHPEKKEDKSSLPERLATWEELLTTAPSVLELLVE